MSIEIGSKIRMLNAVPGKIEGNPSHIEEIDEGSICTVVDYSNGWLVAEWTNPQTGEHIVYRGAPYFGLFEFVE